MVYCSTLRAWLHWGTCDVPTGAEIRLLGPSTHRFHRSTGPVSQSTSPTRSAAHEPFPFRPHFAHPHRPSGTGVIIRSRNEVKVSITRFLLLPGVSFNSSSVHPWIPHSLSPVCVHSPEHGPRGSAQVGPPPSVKEPKATLLPYIPTTSVWRRAVLRWQNYLRAVELGFTIRT